MRSAENPWLVASAAAFPQNVNTHSGSKNPCFRYAVSFGASTRLPVAMALSTSMPAACIACRAAASVPSSAM
jgi:hypothetical protein